MIPNHGLIIHALLYGDDDFQKSLMIVNTSGWDTDCNASNVGCLLGIKNGLAGIESGPDYRGPVADRLYLATADGGRAISDALTESYHVINSGRALAGEAPLAPKQGARFHFEMPGSVQGFQADEGVEARGVLRVENVVGHSERGSRSLALRYARLATGRVARAGSPVFTPSREVGDYFEKRGYALLASPAVYSGQTIHAALTADAANPSPVRCNLYLRRYTAPDDSLELLPGPQVTLLPGTSHTFAWPITGSGSEPIAEVGVEIHSDARTEGSLYLDYLTWDGTPDVVFTRPQAGGRGTTGAQMWRRAWVLGVDDYNPQWPEAFRLVQNAGRGLLSIGTREWTDYAASSSLTVHLASAAGIAVRVQGMRRYYALLLCHDGRARLIKALDGESTGRNSLPVGFRRQLRSAPGCQGDASGRPHRRADALCRGRRGTPVDRWWCGFCGGGRPHHERVYAGDRGGLKRGPGRLRSFWQPLTSKNGFSFPALFGYTGSNPMSLDVGVTIVDPLTLH